MVNQLENGQCVKTYVLYKDQIAKENIWESKRNFVIDGTLPLVLWLNLNFDYLSLFWCFIAS